jgi:hypothetical protein
MRVNPRRLGVKVGTPEELHVSRANLRKLYTSL